MAVLSENARLTYPPMESPTRMARNGRVIEGGCHVIGIVVEGKRPERRIRLAVATEIERDGSEMRRECRHLAPTWSDSTEKRGENGRDTVRGHRTRPDTMGVGKHRGILDVRVARSFVALPVGESRGC